MFAAKFIRDRIFRHIFVWKVKRSCYWKSNDHFTIKRNGTNNYKPLLLLGGIQQCNLIWKMWRGAFSKYCLFLSKTEHVCMLSHFSHVQLFCNPMDHSLPGSSVHGIFPARILAWVAISYSGDLSDPGLHVRNNELLEHSTSYLTRSKVNTSIFSSLWKYCWRQKFRECGSSGN